MHVKGDWDLPIIKKDMIYKKFIFQLKSKYVCEIVEGDLEIKDCEYDVGEVNIINWKNILKHDKDRNIDIFMLGASKSRLHHYSIMAKILIFMLYFVIIGISNLTIKLS